MPGGRFQGDLPQRTFEFGAINLELVDQLPSGTKGWVLGKQLTRSATSVGANICEADEALTEAEFLYRCGVARKEASETRYWLHMCCRTGLLRPDQVACVIEEAGELVRILTAVVKKTQERQERQS